LKHHHTVVQEAVEEAVYAKTERPTARNVVMEHSERRE